MTFSGPIHKRRAWFSEALSLQHDFALVRELPPGSDTSEDWSTSSIHFIKRDQRNGLA